MANKIILKHKSNTTGAPLVGDLELGELALNTIDGIVYMEIDDDGAGTNARIVEVGGTGGAVVYIADWDASTSLPVVPSDANKGHYWKVTTAGGTNADGITDWRLDDWLVSTGTGWQQLQSTMTRAGVANGVASLDGSSQIPIAQIPDAVIGGMQYQAAWNANTNVPNIGLDTSTYSEGYFWIVSDAGSTNLGGITTWNVNDKAIWDGDAWARIANTDVVTSVAGKTGNVLLVKADVGLGNVDNTSDANKPVSTATQTALNAKVTGPNNGADGQFLGMNGVTPTWQGIPGGIDTFIALTDTPANYLANANKFAVVNNGNGTDGNAIEFTDTIDGGIY